MVYIFVAYCYSSNIPLLSLLSLLILISNYICYKHLILKYSVRITSDESLNSIVINFFPMILIIHTCFSLWSFTVN